MLQNYFKNKIKSFTSLAAAKRFARKIESENDTCFSGNFANPLWVVFNDTHLVRCVRNDEYCVKFELIKKIKE